ncbi:MAG: hypothetical protein R3Y27_03000 [Clostridia bacterium]
MKDLIVLAIIIVILAIPTIYIIRAKKNGIHCIGCPDAKVCGGKCSHSEDDIVEVSSQDIPPSCGGNCSNCSGCNGGSH